MKNYLVIILFAFSLPVIITSCKDDENPGSALIGTWEEVSYVASGCLDPDDNEATTCTSSCEQIVVTENTVKIGSSPALSYTVSGNTLTISQSSGGATISFSVNFAVNGNTLTITQQDEPVDGGCKSVSTYQRL